MPHTNGRTARISEFPYRPLTVDLEVRRQQHQRQQWRQRILRRTTKRVSLLDFIVASYPYGSRGSSTIEIMSCQNLGSFFMQRFLKKCLWEDLHLDINADRDLAKVPSPANQPPKLALLPKQPFAVYVIVESPRSHDYSLNYLSSSGPLSQSAQNSTFDNFSPPQNSSATSKSQVPAKIRPTCPPTRPPQSDHPPSEHRECDEENRGKQYPGVHRRYQGE